MVAGSTSSSLILPQVKVAHLGSLCVERLKPPVQLENGDENVWKPSRHRVLRPRVSQVCV